MAVACGYAHTLALAERGKTRSLPAATETSAVWGRAGGNGGNGGVRD